ncbi:MAG TPA: beta-ketoacyl synthase N-terminal-like domain-containing protein [Puia sp.]|nr:beta-ketoacyl synthase N-terminal-like domain-containing protein [Puia sp.]
MNRQKDIFIVADNIVSPLGGTTAENFSRLVAGITGVRRQERPEMADQPFYAALFEAPGGEPLAGTLTGGEPLAIARDGAGARFTTFEQLLVNSMSDALHQAPGIHPDDDRTILIVCSTKGNTHLLDIDDRMPAEHISLPGSAAVVARHFGFTQTPIVVSNACISGLLGMITGVRLLRSGLFNNAVVTGADVITKFILSGFGSFQALSPGHCRPFDRDRDGINLGEGAGTMILSTRREYRDGLQLRGGAVSNDANHISGPSRTGKELGDAIDGALRDAGCAATDVSFISAHGTATAYNDEMEAKAITLAGLNGVPVNSLKGYYGHTLGAAGLIESIVTLASMREGLVIPSLGFENNGVTTPLNMCRSLLRTSLDTCLKTASGFGGCNAAVVLGK